MSSPTSTQLKKKNIVQQHLNLSVLSITALTTSWLDLWFPTIPALEWALDLWPLPEGVNIHQSTPEAVWKRTFGTASPDYQILKERLGCFTPSDPRVESLRNVLLNRVSPGWSYTGDSWRRSAMNSESPEGFFHPARERETLIKPGKLEALDLLLSTSKVFSPIDGL